MRLGKALVSITRGLATITVLALWAGTWTPDTAEFEKDLLTMVSVTFAFATVFGVCLQFIVEMFDRG